MTDVNFPEFGSFAPPGMQVGGLFSSIGKGLKSVGRVVKKATKNPAIVAAVPGVGVPAAFLAHKPKTALKTTVASGKLSAGLALNFSKSADAVKDASKIIDNVRNPAVIRAIKNTASIAKGGNPAAKKTMKILHAVKVAKKKKTPPKKPGLSVSHKGKAIKGVLIDSRGIVSRGTFYK